MPNIPQRKPIGDTFSGLILQAGDDYLLAAAAQADAAIAHRGEFIVRYGIGYLDRPLSIVPALVVVDYGDAFVGQAMWDFLLKRSNLYPRADVIGYQSDGKDEMTVLKKLDIMRPFDVLIYSNSEATAPLLRAKGFIGDEADYQQLPDRLRQYLGRYENIATWQANYRERP